MKKLISAVLSFVMLLSVFSGSGMQAMAAGSSISSATSISFGTTYSGYINSQNSQDFYKIRLNSSGRINISSKAYMKWIYIKVYDKNGNELFSGNPQWNSNTQQISYSKDLYYNSGTYYVAFTRDGNDGSYNFCITYKSANESFAEGEDYGNDMLYDASNASVNTRYYAQLSDNESVDFYRVTLSSSGTITYSLNAYMEWIYVKIFDIDGDEFYSSNPRWNSNTGKITFTPSVCLTSGTYYFCFAKDSRHSGFYDFALNFKSANESFKEKDGGANNNIIGRANPIKLNTTYRGQLAKNDSVDMYSLSVSSGEYKLKVNANTEWIYIMLYDASGNEFYSRNPRWNSNTNVITFNESIVLTKGNYYLGFVRDGSHEGNYSFSFGRNVNIASPNRLYVSKRKASSLALSWGKVSGAGGYQLQRKSGNSWKTVTSTKSTGYTVSTLKAGTTYKFRVRAYKTVSGSKYYSTWTSLTTATKPSAPSLKAVSSNSQHQIVSKWSRVSACSGYQIQYSKKKDFSSVIATKTVSGSSSTAYTGKNFTKGKTYYVRVRSYKSVNSNKYYSSWSSAKSIKCK